jgi:limonene-1,2-epoxide hydrolase
MDSDAAGQFLALYVASWNRHDLDSVISTYLVDAKRFSGIGVVTGRDSIRKSIAAFVGAFPDSHVTTVNWASRGDVILYEALDEATHNGPLSTPWGVIEPTGRSVRIEAAGVMVLQSDAIAIERVYFEINELYRQLGLLGENGHSETVSTGG